MELPGTQDSMPGIQDVLPTTSWTGNRGSFDQHLLRERTLRPEPPELVVRCLDLGWRGQPTHLADIRVASKFLPRR